METNMCNGDCSKCSFQQRVYCASYMARNNYAMIETIMNKIDSMQVKINELQANNVELKKPFGKNDETFESVNTMGQVV